MKQKYYDMIGKKYNRLTVIGVRKEGSNVICECECECGNRAEVVAWNIRKGGTKSCGCARRGKREKKGRKEYKFVKKVSEREYDEIFERIGRGEEIKKVAEEYGISRQSIYLERKMREDERGDGK